jgi:hypothetical protein
VFPVPWSPRWSWSLHLFLGRPMFLRRFGLFCNACFGILSVSILRTCCSHFSWYCFVPLPPFEHFTSVSMSPEYVTGPSQGESGGGAATLMALDFPGISDLISRKCPSFKFSSKCSILPVSSFNLNPHY